jgi:chromosome segregation ATPase
MIDELSDELKRLGIHPPPQFGVHDERTFPRSPEVDPDSIAAQITQAEDQKRQARVAGAERALAEQQRAWEIEAAELARAAENNGPAITRLRSSIESLRAVRAPVAEKLMALDLEIAARREEIRGLLPAKRVERDATGKITQIVEVPR